MEVVALSQKTHAISEPASATIPAESQLTSAQPNRIEKNRREAIQRRDERSRRTDSELELNSTSPRTNYNRSLINQLRAFFMDELYYTACLTCTTFHFVVNHLPHESKPTTNVGKLRYIYLLRKPYLPFDCVVLKRFLACFYIQINIHSCRLFFL